jgi:hypothetical protein
VMFSPRPPAAMQNPSALSSRISSSSTRCTCRRLGR